MKRSESDLALGILRVTVGDAEFEVPTLRMRASRAWLAKLRKASGRFDLPDLGSWTEATVNVYHDQFAEAMLDLIAEYDAGNVLGGRDTLEDLFDPEQAYAVLVDMAEIAHPKAPSAAQLLAAVTALAAAGSVLENSTKSPSPSGDSTPEPLTTVSTTPNGEP
jgi:hypothetical protein